MKRHTLWLSLVLLLGFSSGVNAFWSNNWGNNNWGNGNNQNSYDVWDPRYWAEEMGDMFDNDDWWGNNRYYNAYPNMHNNMYRPIATTPINKKYLPKYNPYLRYGR